MYSLYTTSDFKESRIRTISLACCMGRKSSNSECTRYKGLFTVLIRKMSRANKFVSMELYAMNPANKEGLYTWRANTPSEPSEWPKANTLLSLMFSDFLSAVIIEHKE